MSAGAPDSFMTGFYWKEYYCLIFIKVFAGAGRTVQRYCWYIINALGCSIQTHRRMFMAGSMKTSAAPQNRYGACNSGSWYPVEQK
jgi:hypothetical protein